MDIFAFVNAYREECDIANCDYGYGSVDFTYDAIRSWEEEYNVESECYED